MASVDRQDVKEWARSEPPIVEEQSGEQASGENSSSAPSGGEPQVPDTNNVEEQDNPPSLFQKLKEKIIGGDDPKDEVHAKNADTHPPAGNSSMLLHLQQSMWPSKEEGVKPKSEVFSKKSAAYNPAPPIRITSRTDQVKGIGSDELGTGYEEDTEKGALSSESSAELSDKEDLSPLPGSVFKPVQENNASKMNLDDLRALKTSQNKNAGVVKAPGVLDRAKEEVEAITDQMMEGLNLKGKPEASGDQKENVNHSGFFTRMAAKMGYGGRGRSQGQ